MYIDVADLSVYWFTRSDFLGLSLCLYGRMGDEHFPKTQEGIFFLVR